MAFLILTIIIKGGFLVGYPIPREKIPTPKKPPSPKNPGDKDRGSGISPGFRNPHLWDSAISRDFRLGIFGDLLASRIPNPHPRDRGFFGDFSGDFRGF